MLNRCDAGDKPYGLGAPAGGLVAPSGFLGESPSESCRDFAASVSQSLVAVTQHTCSVTGFTAPFAVIEVCQKNTASPFVMSVADGAALSSLIVSVWVAGLIFRSFIKAVKPSNDGEN